MFKKIAGTLVSVSPAAVFAAVPAEVTTAIADMRADGVTVATGFLVAAIVVTAFLFMRRGAR